jgi:outer membrane protein TolC
VPQVGSLPDPELTAGIFFSPMELVGGNQLADIRLMQMFPWFGVLKAAKDEMSLMAKAKFELFRDAKLQLCLNVQQTWFEMYKLEHAIAISNKNIEIMHTLERLSLVKFRSSSSAGGNASSSGSAMQSGSSSIQISGSSGMNAMGASQGSSSGSAPAQPSATMQGSSGGSGLADLYRLQMEVGELENNISLLKNQRTTLIARFNSYLNRPALSSVMVPDTLKPNSLNIPILAVSDSMLTNNPMLGMLKYEQKSLEARKQMVTKMGYPMVGLGLNYSLINKNPMSTSAMNGKDMIMPMVTVTLPIYRKKYKAVQTETDLLKAATMHGIQATANSLQAEYYEVVQNYQDAQGRMELYKNQYQLASQTLNILMKSFSSSGSGLTDLLRVRQQTLDYGLKQVDAVADYNIAIARLQRLMANSKIQ